MNSVNTQFAEERYSSRRHPHIGVLLERGRRLVVANVMARFQREGFTDLRDAHALVFVYLPLKGARLTQLAARARVTKQSMGEVVRELEALGYVQRAGDPADARARIITLTERGHRANEIGMQEIVRTEAEWSQLVGADAVRSLRETLERITSPVGMADEPA